MACLVIRRGNYLISDGTDLGIVVHNLGKSQEECTARSRLPRSVVHIARYDFKCLPHPMGWNSEALLRIAVSDEGVELA